MKKTKNTKKTTVKKIKKEKATSLADSLILAAVYPNTDFTTTYQKLRDVFDTIDVQADVGLRELEDALLEINRLSSDLIEHTSYLILKNKENDSSI